MNEDQMPLFEDAESSNSDILRVARERAEVAYLKAKRDGMRDPVEGSSKAVVIKKTREIFTPGRGGMTFV
jgi:hypothetical protein